METNQTFQQIQSLKLRLTPIRRKLIDLLDQSEKPISVGDILSKINANKTTIYREINTLLFHDLLTVIDLGDGTKRYELSTKGHHHHLICIKCKSITELDLADDFTKEEALIASQTKFKVLRHALEFFGFCQNCHSFKNSNEI